MNLNAEIARAQGLHQKGNLREAAGIYRNVLKLQPDHPDAVHFLGIAAAQAGRPVEAIPLFERAIALAPKNPWPRKNLGAVLLEMKRATEAEKHFRKATSLDAGFSEAWFGLANALRAIGRADDATAAYRKALVIEPNNPLFMNNLGTHLQALGDADAALSLFRAAVKLAPNRPEPLSNLISLLERSNALDEIEGLAGHLARIAPDSPWSRLARARALRRAGKNEEARDLMQPAIAANPPPEVLFSMQYELGRILDALGDYPGAFAAATAAKASRMAMPDMRSLDFNAYPTEILHRARWFTRERIAQIPPAPSDGSAPPIFFVGFPRSGTTLMEQVLASHPAFVTTEEASPLPQCFIKAKDAIGRSVGVPFDLPDLSVVERNRMREHFVAIGREVTGNSLTDRILVDKLPLNLAELSVANWLFPDGKAIVALRDPRDAVLSCYMQHFQINTAMMQFLDLERSAKIYALVMDIWLHYREILTMRWIEYRYEDLIADFEGTVRRVLDFAGPGWHDSVNSYAERAKQTRVATPSYAAVTQPINNRAVGRWRNYREQLAPILPILAPYVEKFGYDPD